MIHSVQLDNGWQLHLALMTEVSNAAQVREQLMNGSLQCCIVQTRLICSPLQVAAAANKAVLSAACDMLITHNIHTELLYNLAPSRNITQALHRFGVNDTDTDMLVCIVRAGEDGQNESLMEAALQVIRGKHCDLNHLMQLCDVHLVQQTYGIKEKELAISTLENSVVSRIAAKDCL